MKNALLVCGLAAAHFVASFFASFAAGIGGGVWRIVSNILMFPLSLIPQSAPDLPPWLMWPLWITVSFCWAFAIVFLIRAATK